MEFLSPMSIAIAAGLTVPPLVLLYFLKLRRKTQDISSTLLWKRAVQDLHVNAPFQKLRRNLLLLLQLLILALLALALGYPIIKDSEAHRGTVILMIDHSASMNIVEPDGKTRLEHAREQAKTTIDNMADNARVMVVSFADDASIIASFGSRKPDLKNKIDSIEPTDSLSMLGEAMSLAEAHAATLVTGAEDDPWAIIEPEREIAASLILFSDGRIEDAADLVANRFKAENMELVAIGQRTDNVGITRIGARREYEQPDKLEVYAEVRNYGEEAVSFDVTLRVNGQIADVKTVGDLQPGFVVSDGEEEASTSGLVLSGEALTQSGPPPGSVASIAFDEVSFGGGAVLEVHIGLEDAMKTDNAAWTVIDPPRGTEVLLVTPGNLFLDRVLPTLPIQLTRMSPDEYENAKEEDLMLGNRSRFDLIILDQHSTDRLPPGNYMFWNSVPLIEGVSIGEPVRNEFIVNWQDTHPILRHVSVGTINVGEWSKVSLPPEADVLINGETTPVLSLLAREGRQYLICSFSLLVVDGETGQPSMNTLWPTQSHFPVFMYNAIQYLSSSLTTKDRESLRPGDSILLPVPVGVDSLLVRGPDGKTYDTPTGGALKVPFGQTREVGKYTVEPCEDEIEGAFVVNLFSETESNVAPNENFSIGAQVISATEKETALNRPLWPWLLLGALAILMLEWIVYNKRVLV